VVLGIRAERIAIADERDVRRLPREGRSCGSGEAEYRDGPGAEPGDRQRACALLALS
jgi:hypothetical protein